MHNKKTINYRDMRKLVFVAAMAIIGSTACSSSDGKKAEDTKKETKNEETVEAPSLLVEDGGTVHLTKQMFLDKIMDYEKNPKEWVYKGDMPGLVDFYADWCRPCKITSPILEELAAEYKGKVVIYKVDVEKERELAGIFGVQSIPTFLFMPMEGNPTISSGIAQTPEETKEMFRQQIDQVLLNKKAE